MKRPPIERQYDNTMLTAESAYLWAVFLRNEADMCDDLEQFDTFATIAEQLRPIATNMQRKAYVHYQELEQAMERYI